MYFVTKEEEIKLSTSVQVLYFYTLSMPFYKKAIHLLSVLEEQYSQSKIIAIDAEYFSNQCIRFGVVSTPTLIFFKNGREARRIEGSVKKKDFIDAFHDIYTSGPY
jgi:thioredoxin-related protein